MASNGTGRTGTSKFIICPMASPDIGEAERGMINEALIDNQIGHGRFIAEFEDGWSNMNGYNYGVSCNSGTNAIFLALKACGAKKVLMPNFTMAGGTWPAIYAGLEITYYDTREDLPLPRMPGSFDEYDAVVFVHLYGRRAYSEGSIKLLKEIWPNITIIDDMAEAHGIRPEGDIACYSFYGNKILTTGEGGMCLTNNPILAEEMRSLANMYFDKERSMIHPKVGYNFRMTNLQAAIGVAQMGRLKEFNTKRKLIESWYRKYLPASMLLPDREVVWFYDIKVKNAEKLKARLKIKGVDSRRMFYPMSLQPWGNGMPDKNGEYWYKHGLLLPCHTGMIESEVKWICETLVSVV